MFNLSLSRGSLVPYLGYSIDSWFVSVFCYWFEETNQSYFMALFFLLSGFFTPSSFDKKGRQLFLKDKFLRLGIPCLSWYLVLGPLFNYSMATSLYNKGDEWYHAAYANTWFVGGPPWFIMWLLNINVVYAFADGPPLSLPAPSMGAVLMVAFALGLAQTVLPASSFDQVPLGLKMLVAYPSFFCIGVAAKRGAWLDALGELSLGSVRFVRCLAAVSSAALLTVFIVKRKATAADPAAAFDASTASFVYFVMGFLCVVMSLAQLQFFRQFCSGTGQVMRFLATGAYTVYLIHPYFIVYSAVAYVRILQACGVEVTLLLEIAPGVPTPNPGYVIHSDSEGYMWLAFVFTSVLCFSCWPVAYLLAKLPGLRMIL